MARTPRSKKPRLDALDGVTDPRAPLDSSALLAAARPLLARLEADLRARAAASPAVTRALEERHAQERQAERTAESFAGWSAALATQVAAGWLLSCVFVRTLEDRGLLRQARLAGPGALDSQRLFFQLAPSLNERDYLLTVFRELAAHPAAGDLFDAEHSLVWKLSPSADLAKQLLAMFRTPSADAPAFRFGQASTRFLGDLYQDLSEDVRKRYALLQTPDFVESFILDRTLEPAIERFGLDDTTLIDPTCGSGHFLLGAFDRLFEHRLRAEPGLDRRVAATLALKAVSGVDINPYAVAIARFRLTMSYLEKAGYTKLADAPKLELHLVVADSLRINRQHPQPELWQHDGADANRWLGDAFALEDEAAAHKVLGRDYAAVVGNPPYITEKDPAKREVYRRMYVSAAGKYALSAPFCERFFQLARQTGYVGQITANSFMKREFGKKLIEEYLPGVNLELIVNTSGAHIPGHGTPTVLLFGTAESPVERDVLAVLAKRGEPSTPEDPAKGLVWTSIVDHWHEVAFDNEYVSVARVERASVSMHPWSLGGGGAAELKELLEERAPMRLRELVDDIGFASFTGLDDAFILPRSSAATLGLEDYVVRPMVLGESVRDWAMSPMDVAITPYSKSTQEPLDFSPDTSWGRFLWRYRTLARNVASFGGKTREEEGQSWWNWYRWQSARYLAPFRIGFAFVATHNQFVLSRGGTVFSRTAPIITLPATSTEADYLALLAYLNSSTACFWMKQVFFEKSSQNYVGDVRDKPERIHYEFTGTGLENLPVPSEHDSLAPLAAELTALADQRARAAPASLLRHGEELGLGLESMRATKGRYEALLRKMIVLQEELDWECYAAIGLCDSSLLARQAGIDLRDCQADVNDRPYLGGVPRDPSLAALWAARVAAIHATTVLRALEQPLFKRPWLGTQGVFHRDGWTYAGLAGEALADWLTGRVENKLREYDGPQTLRTINEAFDFELLHSALEFAEIVTDPSEYVSNQIRAESVPFLAAMRFTESGLVRHNEWLAVWDAQRVEDAGGPHTTSVPTKFGTKDMREGSYYSLRGQLDVPKERFISYPGCESDDDGEQVYGWAGWDHLRRSRALASLYLRRKDGEGWIKERLTPMLAGLLELMPWVKQWHNEPSVEFDGLRMGDYFAQFLDAECRQHGLSHDDLRAWRPTKKSARKKSAKAARPIEGTSPADGATTTAKPTRSRKPKVVAPEQAEEG